MSSEFGVIQTAPDGRRIAFASGRSGENEEIWLADADAACYEAKRRGRGTVVMASVRPQQLDTQHLAAAVEA